MPSKQFLQVQGFSDDELSKELETLQSQYQQMQFDHTLRGLENPLALREVRRDVARLKTEVRRREIAAMTPEQLAGRSKKIARRRNQ